MRGRACRVPRAGYLTLAAVLVLAVITGVLVYQGNQPPATAGTPTVASTASGTTSAASAAPSRPARPTNVPMTQAQGGREAAAVHHLLLRRRRRSRQVAGVHEGGRADRLPVQRLPHRHLPADRRQQDGVHRSRARSPASRRSGSAAPTPRCATRIKDLNAAYAAGHEIGTHYNGHFCSGAEPSVGVWNTADWNNELDQFFGFLKNYKKNNPGAEAADAERCRRPSIKGGRTPCLEGQWDQLVPAWKQHKMTYDSSMNAPASGVYWPQKVDGIWEFYMPYVYSPGLRRHGREHGLQHVGEVQRRRRRAVHRARSARRRSTRPTSTSTTRPTTATARR